MFEIIAVALAFWPSDRAQCVATPGSVRAAPPSISLVTAPGGVHVRVDRALHLEPCRGFRAIRYSNGVIAFANGESYEIAGNTLKPVTPAPPAFAADGTDRSMPSATLDYERLPQGLVEHRIERRKAGRFNVLAYVRVIGIRKLSEITIARTPHEVVGLSAMPTSPDSGRSSIVFVLEQASDGARVTNLRLTR